MKRLFAKIHEYVLEKAKARRENRRSGWRILVNPRFQLKLGAYFHFIGLSAMLVLNVTVISYMLGLVNLGQTSEPGTDVLFLMTETLDRPL